MNRVRDNKDLLLTGSHRISKPKQLQTHSKHSLFPKGRTRGIPYDAGTVLDVQSKEGNGWEKLKCVGGQATHETSADTGLSL